MLDRAPARYWRLGTPARLHAVRTVLGVVGVDLKKDAAKLVRAYDERAGVTAAFNLNLLERINRGARRQFRLEGVQAQGHLQSPDGRVELHLVSSREQSVKIQGRRIPFCAGASIRTENSYKYSVGQFRALARSANWHPSQVWADSRELFSVHELVSSCDASRSRGGTTARAITAYQWRRPHAQPTFGIS